MASISLTILIDFMNGTELDNLHSLDIVDQRGPIDEYNC